MKKMTIVSFMGKYTSKYYWEAAREENRCSLFLLRSEACVLLWNWTQPLHRLWLLPVVYQLNSSIWLSSLQLLKPHHLSDHLVSQPTNNNSLPFVCTKRERVHSSLACVYAVVHQPLPLSNAFLIVTLRLKRRKKISHFIPSWPRVEIENKITIVWSYCAKN